MSQYLAYKNNKIVMVGKSKEILENLPLMLFDYIIKTEEEYVFIDNEYLPKNKISVKKAISARVAEYPSIEEQLDMLYWDKINNTNIWKNTITRIKKKYPKD